MKFNALILKYNGKELQETGMYSYGWRDYMPDLGRWNGIDQLAESYLSTSPFAYVANNPVSRFDVDGRWMDDSVHITDTTGQTFGFHGSQYNPLMSFSTYDGMHTNEGSGVTDNGNNRIAQGPKPSIFETIGNFFRNLFGRNKTKNKVEVGPAEKISEERFSNQISTWQIVSALLFNSTDPYSGN
ncbi:RHS repeat-associated core domain-containing protein [Chryseobacterium culicis]|uniref:RHS repeat-associated core domain-containing protein n=1 Tax=Chryseobacterium culicis TaxID=680127 RepID=UPI000ADCFA7A|nr:RHS repeat-associated core domain-containing protein [Chryseobacterium culicis]